MAEDQKPNKPSIGKLILTFIYILVYLVVLLMGSLYALIIALLMTILLAGRIIGEEKALANELLGYNEYKKESKIPFIPGDLVKYINSRDGF